MRIHFVLLAGLLFLYGCTSMQKKEERYFVTKLGVDTIAVESFKTASSSVQGTSVVRVPKTVTRTFSMTLDNAGLPESFSLTTGPADGGSQIVREYRYYDDSIVVVTTQNGSSKSTTINVAGRPFPFFANLFGVWDYAIKHALQSPRTREVSMLVGTRESKYTVDGLAPGKLELISPPNGFGPLYATVDSAKGLMAFDLTPTTDKFIAERVPSLDVDAITKSFASEEQQGKGLGTLSPRDTARTSLDGAEVLVDYGRPSMRGRTIFGGVVPWNTVWRLGANAATQLVTSKTLRFGSVKVQPGTYSLFALPSESGWKLIINKQHGQWGTVYDSTQDLGRVPLKTEQLNEPVDQFTFSVEVHEKSGLLSFEWERTEELIPFSVQ